VIEPEMRNVKRTNKKDANSLEKQAVQIFPGLSLPDASLSDRGTDRLTSDPKSLSRLSRPCGF
jgi:hypothetical protein